MLRTHLAIVIALCVGSIERASGGEAELLAGLNEPERAYVGNRLRADEVAFKRNKPLEDLPTLRWLELGGVGRLASGPRVVYQVIGPKEMLVSVSKLELFPASRETPNPLCWVVGFDTTGVVNGTAVHLEGVYSIGGTKTYKTESGSNTVFYIALVDETSAKQVVEQILKLRCTRTWRDPSGQFEQKDATFEDFKDGKVVLTRSDTGKQIEVPMGKLSREDQKWVRDELRRRILRRRPLIPSAAGSMNKGRSISAG